MIIKVEGEVKEAHKQSYPGLSSLASLKTDQYSRRRSDSCKNDLYSLDLEHSVGEDTSGDHCVSLKSEQYSGRSTDSCELRWDKRTTDASPWRKRTEPSVR